MMEKELKASILLAVTTAMWGTSYVVTKIGLNELGQFSLLAYRFLIAFMVTGIVFRKSLKTLDKETIKYSIILAVIAFVGFVLINYGLMVTSASKSGFLIAQSVVLIPIISYIFLHERIEKKSIIAVFITLVGIALLSLNGGFTITLGDFLCLLSALVFAVHVITMGILTRKVNSINLSVMQIAFIGIISLIASLIMGDLAVPKTTESWICIFVLSILCTAFGYVAQGVAQNYVSSVKTGIIISLEPVFSAMFGFIILKEVLPIRGYVGGLIIFIGTLISVVDFKKLSNKEEDTIIEP